MSATLIKIDRNGSKHYEGHVTCDRCEGRGIFFVGVHNGIGVPSPYDGGVCYKCGGSGKVLGKWIERTPEYQAKLDARRAAKLAQLQAKMDEERREREAQKAAEEARVAAQKAISQYVGQIGEKIECTVTYQFTASYESRFGWQTVTVYIHRFKDAADNVFIWKTQTNPFDCEKGDIVTLKGTVKAHSEYKDEKQTEMTRCKVITKGD